MTILDPRIYQNGFHSYKFVVPAKLYIPSTLNIDLILWHTHYITSTLNIDIILRHRQSIVCAVKGAMDKKADGDICAHLLCFSTIFSEIRSTSVFFRGRLNGAVKSDLTLQHSAHFALHSTRSELVFPHFCF